MTNDLRLALDRRSGFQFRAKADVLERRWKHSAPRSDHRSELFDRTREVARLLRQGRQQEVADWMTNQSWTFIEPMLEEMFEVRFAIRERQQTIPRITWRKDSQLLPEEP
jgi:hypothetical protein